MAEPNPYEPPSAALIPEPRPTVSKLDRLVATRMLLMREQGGLRLGLFFRWSARQYVFIVIYFGLLLALFAHLEIWPMFTFMVGMLIGILSTQAGTVRAHWRVWPFTQRVTDWEKVERIARGEEV